MFPFIVILNRFGITFENGYYVISYSIGECLENNW